MSLIRDELRTGILVVLTSTVLAAVLIYLEAPGIAGQGNPNPPSIFANHALAVVTLNGVTRFYDPSYGRTFTDLTQIDQEAMDGYFTGTTRVINGVSKGVILIRKNDILIRVNLKENLLPNGARRTYE